MKKKKLKKLLKLALSNLSSSVEKVTKPINEWLVVYTDIINRRGYKKQTIKNRTANIKHISRLWGNTQLHLLKPFEITKGLQEFLPLHSSSANRVFGELRDMYTEAIANSWVETNPTSYVKPPKHKVIRQRLSFEDWLSAYEVSKTKSYKWVSILMLLALLTGQRRSDLVKMKFTDVVDGCLRVEQHKQAGKGYGARLAIPLSLKLDIINMSLADVLEMSKSYGKPSDYILKKHNGDCLEESSLSARFRECLSEAKGDNIYQQYEFPSLHEVRSLSARLFKKQGINTQILLGHKTADMTAVYEDDRGLSAGEWKVVEYVVDNKPNII